MTIGKRMNKKTERLGFATALWSPFGRNNKSYAGIKEVQAGIKPIPVNINHFHSEWNKVKQVSVFKEQ